MLSRDRVLEGAVTLADEVGMAGFTLRKLAAVLDVKPMTIYHHVPNKEAILDGMVDRVFTEIELPRGADWKAALRHRANSARAVLARHPWATPLMESRTQPGPATLTHHDAVIGCLRGAGFSVTMTAHAYALFRSSTVMDSEPSSKNKVERKIGSEQSSSISLEIILFPATL